MNKLKYVRAEQTTYGKFELTIQFEENDAVIELTDKMNKDEVINSLKLLIHRLENK